MQEPRGRRCWWSTDQNDRRHIRCLVPGAKEERGERIHHSLPEILGKSKEAQKRIYGEQREHNLEKLNRVQDAPKFTDVRSEALSEWRGEGVGPKVFVFTKTDPVNMNNERMW